MKTKTTYILKLNGEEIETYTDKKTALESRDRWTYARPCSHQDGGDGTGYKVYRRDEKQVRQ